MLERTFLLETDLNSKFSVVVFGLHSLDLVTGLF